MMKISMFYVYKYIKKALKLKKEKEGKKTQEQ